MTTDKHHRLVECRELLQREGLSSVRELAPRLGVSERSALRYLRELEGRPRKADYYEERMPLILAHLRRYPRSRFTRCDLARVVLGDRSVHLEQTLHRMEGEGFVTSTVEPRIDGLFSPDQPVIWWQLREDGARTASQAQDRWGEE